MIAATALALLFSSAVLTPDQQSAFDVATDALTRCIRLEATLLDDDKSDAQTIATAAMGACHQEYTKFVEASLPGDEEMRNKLLYDQPPPTDVAAIIVLQERKRRSSTAKRR